MTGLIHTSSVAPERLSRAARRVRIALALAALCAATAGARPYAGG